VRVLIADDERLVRYTIRSMLEEMPVSFSAIHEVRDGEALVEAVRRLEPHLVLADIQMPKLNGLRAIAELVRDYPQTVFIILSAHNDFGYAQEAIRLGVFRYLLKPVEPAELEPAIRAAAGRIVVGTGPESPVATAGPDETGGVRYSSLIRRCRQWMAENYREPAGLNEAAGALGITPAYLSTTFKAQTGETFLKRLTRMRMDKAKELIERGAAVGDVARSVGYTSARHFARRFREQFGASPTELRENTPKKD